MKRFFLLLFALAMFAAACGSDDAVSTTADGADGDQTTQPAPGNEPADDNDGDAAEPPVGGPLGGGPYPVGTLEFVVTHPDNADLRYTISCLGDTATLLGDWSPNDGDTIGNIAADEMCLRLADPAVQDVLTVEDPPLQACTEIYGGPEEAVITGELNGAPVNFMGHRANGCGIHDWDSTLAGLLPPAA